VGDGIARSNLPMRQLRARLANRPSLLPDRASRRSEMMRLASCSLGSYGWFTEVLDSLDLKEAKTLLEELN
jgi:hypothetical protein